jgi:nucleotide-binding universal stress UspA family protein
MIILSRDKTVLGSAVQHLALNTPCPVLIVKDENGIRSNKAGHKFRVAVCSDGSEQSIKALNFMTRLMDRRKGD